MRLDLLKQACEVAGCDVYREHREYDISEFSIAIPINQGARWRVPGSHPMLPAYVASLLVAKCQTDRGRFDLTNNAGAFVFKEEWSEARNIGEPGLSACYAFLVGGPFIHIAAAMVALDEWDMPTAQEFIASCQG